MDFSQWDKSWFVILLLPIVTSFILTFIIKRAAIHVSALDMPNERKVHKVPMPRCGGLAIYAAFLVGFMFYGQKSTQMLSILIGSFLIVLLGFFDDIKPIRAKLKFLVQIIAASIVVIYGKTYFNEITFLGLNFSFPVWFNIFLSIFFIVAVANAINLIDGLDGLAAGISSINFATIASIALVKDNLGGLDIVLSLLMLGSTLGFLGHNFPPASIFMGDSGSLFLGFMIAVISLLGFKVTTMTSLVVPLLILAVPVFDTLLAIFRRLLKGESIGKPDKEHLHHQILKMGLGTRKTVIIIYFINILFSVVSILYVVGDNRLAIGIYIVLMILLLILVLKTDILFKHKPKKTVDEDLLKMFDKTYDEEATKFYSILKENLKKEKRTFVVTANPEAFMIGVEKDEYKNMLLDESTTIVPDGIGLVKAGRMIGYDIKERIPGVDIAVKLLEYCDELKMKVYLFGSQHEVITKMEELVKRDYKGIKLVGVKDGYEKDKDAIFDDIYKKKPDVILVALGMPKQEELIYKHLDKFKKGIFVGVGGSFDVISGTKKRAPKIFIKLNLEWLYRILKEPKRLKRFWDNNVKFIFKIRKVKKR